MRTISNNLKSEILNGTISNIILITRKDGVKYGFTDNDVALTVEGQVYTPAPGLQRLRLTMTASAEVSSQTFGSAWLDVPEDDLKGGKFDNCIVEVAWCSWKHVSYGKVVVFTGTLGDITWTDEGFSADVVSFMKQLELIIGNTYTAQCRHSLFSTNKVGVIGKCGLSSTSFTFTGSISSVITPKWKLGGTGYIDVAKGNIQQLSMFITREMHCWQLAINVTPIGLYKSFSITVNPKSGILRDLKINRSRTFSSTTY